jgi:MraZ protein
MVTFIGEYISKVDDRGRLVLPAPLKSCLPAGGDMRLVVKKSIFDDCLEMYTFEEWTKQSQEVKDSLNFFNPKHVQFFREYMRDRDVVEPDSKLGRISISRNLLDAIGVNKEVVFFGIDFKIEIWAKEKFDAARLSNENYTAIAESLAK